MWEKFNFSLYIDKELILQEMISRRGEDIEKSIKQAKQTLKSCFERILARCTIGPYARFFKDYERMLRSVLLSRGMEETLGRFKVASRLVVGLGDESVYETNIRLLRNYGVPYIPGSALKGAAKHWSVWMLSEILRCTAPADSGIYALAESVWRQVEKGKTDIFPDERLPGKLPTVAVEFIRHFGDVRSLREVARVVVRIFGTREKEGGVVFFDALPDPEVFGSDAPPLEFDIVNPHFPGYYRGNEPPGDWSDPVPIFFLTVPVGTVFVIAVAPRETEDRDLARIAFSILKQTLREQGVGAKTSLGYGRLEENHGRPRR